MRCRKFILAAERRVNAAILHRNGMNIEHQSIRLRLDFHLWNVCVCVRVQVSTFCKFILRLFDLFVPKKKEAMTKITQIEANK